jgi:hypothetical protein
MLQHKLGVSLEWILEALSQEDESAETTTRRRQALESLAYAKDILKGSILAVDDTKLFGQRTLNARVDDQGDVPAIYQGPSLISGYPHLSSDSPTTGFEAQRIVKLQNDNPERRRGLGHSSSSPSLTSRSALLSPAAALPRTPWIRAGDKPGGAYSSPELALSKPEQRSASSPSRPMQPEAPEKPPIQHDPLGVL